MSARSEKPTMAVSSHLQIALGEYDERIRTFIPHYEGMLNAAVAALLAARGRIGTVVDLGTGTGALAERVLRGSRRARLIGVDEDEGMLAMAARRLPRGRTTLVADSFRSVALPRCDAVTASFALHHVEHHRAKRALYRRIHAALRPGGVLVDADIHPAVDPVLATADRRAWHRHLAATYGSRKAEAFLRAWADEDFYVPLDVELALMHSAGFTTDVVWRKGAFAVIVARRPKETTKTRRTRRSHEAH